jgi:hypothetical protein
MPITNIGNGKILLCALRIAKTFLDRREIHLLFSSSSQFHNRFDFISGFVTRAATSHAQTR